MNRLTTLALRLFAVALVASLAPACGEQETDTGNGYVPKVMQDTDNDGVPDKCEAFFGTDPNKADTDNDALADGSEDHDGDGYTNYQEMAPYADKDTCPPQPDGGAGQDAKTEDAAEEGGSDDAAPEAEADAQAEAAAVDASDAEAADAAAE